MKHLKKLGLAALAAMAITAATGAGSASATTLEVTTTTQNGPIKFVTSLVAGNSSTWTTTSGSSWNTCTSSNVEGTTSTNTGPTVSGPISTLTFSSCTNPVTVHQKGRLSVSHIAGTTNGTVTSEGAEWTTYSAAIGVYITCKTGTGTHLGTLTGSGHEHATLHINTVLNCGFFLPSAKWEATYTVTIPTGLGVSA